MKKFGAIEWEKIVKGEEIGYKFKWERGNEELDIFIRKLFNEVFSKFDYSDEADE